MTIEILDEKIPDFVFIYEKMSTYYNQFDIYLNKEDFINRQRRHIHKNSWDIRYQFGQDKRGEYIEIYSDHRHPGPGFDRIYIDGYAVSYADLFNVTNFKEFRDIVTARGIFSWE